MNRDATATNARIVQESTPDQPVMCYLYAMAYGSILEETSRKDDHNTTVAVWPNMASEPGREFGTAFYICKGVWCSLLHPSRSDVAQPACS